MARRIVVAATVLAGLSITLIVAIAPEASFSWLEQASSKLIFLAGSYLVLVAAIGWAFGYSNNKKDKAIERHEKLILKNNRFCLILASSVVGLNPGIESIEAITDHGDFSVISTNFGWIEVTMVAVMLVASFFFTMYHKTVIPSEQLI